VQHGQVAADQTGFPVLITAACFATNCPEILTTGNAHAAQSDGGDLRFSTDSAGASQIPCEVVVWSQNATFASAKAEIHVPRNILTGSDVTIYVWWSAGGGLSQPAANAAFGAQSVWDSNYKLVSHLPDGTTLSVADSTGINSPTNHSATATAGMVDGCGNFVAASSQYIDVGASNNLTNLTIEAWFYNQNNVTFQRILSNLTNPTYNGYEMYYGDSPGNSKITFGVASAGTYSVQRTVAGIGNGVWHHVVCTLSGTTQVIYVDGATPSQSRLAGSGVIANSSLNLNIGRWPGSGSDFFDGQIDEVRVSDIARSASWVTTQYNNQNAPGSFVIAGARVDISTGAGLFRAGTLSGLGTGGPFFSNPLS